MRIIHIDGHSMEPTLASGDYVVVHKRRKVPKVGDIVVADHPQMGEIIKRVKSVDIDKQTVSLVGDGSASAPSIDLADLPLESISSYAWFAIRKQGGLSRL